MARNKNIHKYHFIYKTINLVNGKIYVGQKLTSCDNLQPNYLGSGILFQRVIQKYGVENFKREIIEFCTKETINEREKFWIKQLDAMNRSVGYNLCEGGGTTSGYKHTKSTLRKISTSNIGKHHHKRSEEIREKDRIASTGRLHSDQTKKKMSVTATGRITSEETKEKIRNSKKGKPLSESVKINMRISSFKREKVKCNYCDRISFKCNIDQYHNDYCKFNPSRKLKIKIIRKCLYCDYVGTNAGYIGRYHNNNCKHKPNGDQ